MEQQRDNLCDNSRGETRRWSTSPSHSYLFQRQIHNQRPTCIRLYCREAWKLRNCPITKRCNPLCKEGEQLPDNREYTFGEWHPEDIEVYGCSGDVEIWKYPGTDLRSRTRILLTKHEEDKGTVLLDCSIQRIKEQTRFEIPSILRRNRRKLVTHIRMVEYELIITTAFQSKTAIHLWPQQLLQNLSPSKAIIVYSGLRYANDGRLLRFLRKQQISLVSVRRVQGTQDYPIPESMVTRIPSNIENQGWTILEDSEYTNDYTIQLFT